VELGGKTALVTGAARRVGRAIALRLANAGCDVAVHYATSQNEAAEVVHLIEAAGRRGVTIQGDLSDLATAARLVHETHRALGRLDILVNNASVFDRRPLADSDADFWERTFRVNALSPALLAREAAPIMRAAGAGRIVNMADTLSERPPAAYAAYCASKAALAGLTRSLAVELAPLITVNAIAPGIAIFPDAYDAATRERLVARVPLRRAGTPEDVASLVHFLVAEGDYITGQVIALDGGRSVFGGPASRPG
jgi:pteridine reductase